MLRDLGLDDRALVDANQVVSYFNYVNRIADGLGVELEDEWPDERRTVRAYPLAGRSLPPVSRDRLPWVTVEQMREIDRLTMVEIGISLEQMMENAGRALAVAAAHLLGGVAGRRILVLAGPGGNGGGGMVAARHLAGAGAEVELQLASEPERLTDTSRRQLEILRRAGLPVQAAPPDPEQRVDLVVDALLGYSQAGSPRDATADLIRWTSGRRALSLDAPSGLELRNGSLHEPHVVAEATVTLALPKLALRSEGASGAAGLLLLADIGVPAIVYERLGIPYRTPFRLGPLVEIV